MRTEIRLLDGFCGDQGFLVAQKAVFLFNLKSDVLDMLVKGFYGFGSPLDIFLARIPVGNSDSLLKRYLLSFFIYSNAGIDQCFLVVVLAAPDDKVDAEGMRSLHDNSF